LHIKYYKIHMNEKVSFFLPEYSRWFLQGSWPIGQLVANTSMLLWALSSWAYRRPFWAWHWHLLQDRIVDFSKFWFPIEQSIVGHPRSFLLIVKCSGWPHYIPLLTWLPQW
jgi:hypothetical protein